MTRIVRNDEIRMSNDEGMILASESRKLMRKKISERKISKPFRIFRVFRGQIVFLVSIGVLA
jgi:hypothetical protein